VKMTATPGQAEGDIASTVTLTLKDGRVLTERVTEFLGTPARPLTGKEMREKFMLLTQKYPSKQMERIYDRLQNLESEANLEWLHV
jgi:2-methylcitrate dehydratase PrpD